MDIAIQILKLSAGIGMFLFAMYLLEESLKNLSGRNFKIFLQRATKNRIGAVAGGALITAVLQSSSMVSLMVLAFVGAGVFTMKSAMAVILGANLGTTLDSWIVATLGFNTNIEVVAYPAVCIGGLLLITLGKRKAVKYAAYFLLGFGLLFIGLSFMKTAMEAEVKEFNFAKYADTPLIVFLGIGFIITLLVQSSSVTMALTLSALHAGATGFAPAAAIVLGSETGTTIKILLSAIGGNAAKKRVVLGNLLYNIFLTIFAFILLRPILLLITGIFGISDPLIGLVTFSSLINLLSVAVFIPLLGPFAKLLEKSFKGTDASMSAFISHANIAEPRTALDLFEREVEYFIHDCMLFNLSMFDIDIKPFQKNSDFENINDKRKFDLKTPEEKYLFLKQLQGEIQAFYLGLRSQVHGKDYSRLDALISAVRNAMHSAKSMKDVSTNIANLRRSSKDIKYDFFLQHKTETEDLYRQLSLLIAPGEKNEFEYLKDLSDTIQNNYTSALNNFYKQAQHATLEDLDLTTAINFNRELFTSNRAILTAVRSVALQENDDNAGHP